VCVCACPHQTPEANPSLRDVFMNTTNLISFGNKVGGGGGRRGKCWMRMKRGMGDGDGKEKEEEVQDWRRKRRR